MKKGSLFVAAFTLTVYLRLQSLAKLRPFASEFWQLKSSAGGVVEWSRFRMREKLGFHIASLPL